AVVIEISFPEKGRPPALAEYHGDQRLNVLNLTIFEGRVDACPRLRQACSKSKQDFGGRRCSAQKTTNSSPRAVQAPAWANCCAASGSRCCCRRNCLRPTGHRRRSSSWARNC